MRTRYAIDHARSLRTQGYLEMPLDPDFLKDRASVLFEGLEAIKTRDSLQKVFFDGRDNKDKPGRLIQGYFEKKEDCMTQFNFESFADDRIGDYLRNIQGADFVPFFRIFEELNALARMHVGELGRAIDELLTRDQGGGQNAECHRTAKLLTNATTITSATRYRAKIGTSQTSAQPNTAAFAIYWGAEDNPGMRITNRYGKTIDLSEIEKDPSKALAITGEELSLALGNFIEASMHPIFPEREGEMRSTLRTFVYLERQLIEYLKRKQQKLDMSLI